MKSMYHRLLTRALGSVAAIVVVFFVARSAEPPSVHDAHHATLEKIKTESEGRIVLRSFEKTDGQRGELFGVQLYALEFSAVIEFTEDCEWLDEQFGLRRGFKTRPEGEGGTLLEALDPNAGKSVKRGERYRLSGTVLSQRTERSWRVERVEITAVTLEQRPHDGDPASKTSVGGEDRGIPQSVPDFSSVRDVQSIAKQEELTSLRLTYARRLALSVRRFNARHKRPPTSLEEAVAAFPAEPTYGIPLERPEAFELIHHGPIDRVLHPAQVLLLRERQPWQDVRGGMSRTYAYVDGFAQAHYEPKGDFDEWEKRLKAAVGPEATPRRGGEIALREQSAMEVLREDYARQLARAVWLYASTHHRVPDTLEHAAALAPLVVPDASSPVQRSDTFELTFRGLPGALPNPSQVIVLRERRSWHNVRGGQSRVYTFADGRCVTYHTPDGDFTVWERDGLAHNEAWRRALEAARSPSYYTEALKSHVISMGILRVNAAKQLALGVILYSADTRRGPERLEELHAYLALQWPTAASFARFKAFERLEAWELMFRGNVYTLDRAAETIVLRERDPWMNYGPGKGRTYAFADGHAEIQLAEDGNFSAWESRRLAPGAASQSSAQRADRQKLREGEEGDRQRLLHAKSTALSLLIYVRQHGRDAQSVAEALQDYSITTSGAKPPYQDFTAFEVLYKGLPTDLEDASATLLSRGTPWTDSRGGVCRAYAFVDGHVEIRHFKDGNWMQDWEESSLPQIYTGTGDVAAHGIDIGKIVRTFSEGSAEDKAKIQKVVDAVKAGSFAVALEQVRELQFDLLMTPTQEGALMDLLLKLEAKEGGGR